MDRNNCSSSSNVQAGSIDRRCSNAFDRPEGSSFCNHTIPVPVCMALVQVSQEAIMSQPDWIIEMVNGLPPDLREDFEERAAIMEFDGGLPRDHAELLALLNIIRNHPTALIRKKEDLI